MPVAAPNTVAERLAARTACGVVGREAEIALFEGVLAPPLPVLALLWFHGPGGIGKTTLLTRLREHAEAGGRHTVCVDAALLEPAPASFEGALGSDDPRAAAEPGVLFVDTAEQITPLLGWLRRDFLPALPASWLVVLAGRRPPPAEWTTDAAWHGLMRVHAVAPLADDASRALLAARGVLASAHDDMLAWARGHPLALALLADAARAGHMPSAPGVPAASTADDGTPRAEAPLPSAGGLSPESALVQTLVQRFTRDAAAPTLARALRVAALSRHTTEPLLADVLALDDAQPVFESLRQLSFMQAGPHGLAPHDLVRDVLAADAQWRDARDTHRLVRAVYRHHYGRMVATEGRERIHHQSEALYTQRHAEHKSRYFAWDELGLHRVAPARGTDLALLQAIVRRHEGEAALPWLAYWWERQRDGFRLFWRGDGDERCDGFMLMLRLGSGTPESDRADPAVAAAWRFIGTQRPLAPGEELVLLRHWMHTERHQAVSAAINLASMHVVSHLISQPGVAWSVVWMADADFWQPHFDGVNFARCPAADHEIGGRRFGAFVHDWCFEPPAAWVAGEYRPMPFLHNGAAPADDSEACGAFVDAVRQALRDATDVPALGRGVLAARLGLDGPALQNRLREAVAGLAAHPRDAKFRDALWHTYIEPLHKQEQVAAELGIPFPTYRYRLHQGIELLASALAADPAH